MLEACIQLHIERQITIVYIVGGAFINSFLYIYMYLAARE